MNQCGVLTMSSQSQCETEPDRDNTELNLELSNPITEGVVSVETAYKWRIENMNLRMQKKDAGANVIKSPILAFCNDSNLFRLSLYPKVRYHTDNLLCVCLTLNPQQKVNFEADVRFTVLDKYGKEALTSTTLKLRPGMGTRYGPSPGFVQIAHDTLKENKSVLHKGALTIQCKFDVKDMMEVKKDEISDSDRRLQEFDEFEKLLTSGAFSDSTFHVGEKKFCVHKAIVANKSEVFAAMFSADMKENDQNSVKLEDTTCAVFEELLRFIYTGRVSGVKENALDLLIAADKYAINGLRKQCEHYLIQDLDAKNVLQYLKVATLVNAEELKIHSIDFIAQHADRVANQPRFSLDELPKEVITEAFRAVANKKIKISND